MPGLVAMLLAAALIATLAWAGHGAAGSGTTGAVHLASDAMHLVAAAAWVGALVPLAILLGAAFRDHDSHSIGREAVLRFSTLGAVAVSTLLASGIINSWMLVGGLKALIQTNYGRLLSVKVFLFLIMVGIAGVNRIILTPRLLLPGRDAGKAATRLVWRNAVLEAVTGMMILIIVSVLGTLPYEQTE